MAGQIPAKPFYTSSEAMKLTLQPSVPLPRPIPPPPPPAPPPRPQERPDFQPLLKPSMVKRSQTLPPNYAAGSPLNYARLMNRMKENRRVVSPAPQKQPKQRYQAKLPRKDPFSTPSAVSRRAPYLGGGGGGGGGGLRRSASQNAEPLLPYYSSLYDPHLKQYFERKLGLSSNPAQKKCSDRIVETLYKVVVTIGDQAQSGTTANMFIRLNGRTVRVAKERLTKKKGLVKTPDGQRYHFKPKSENTFKFKGPSIKTMNSIVIETDGLTKKEGVFVQEVQVTNMRTKKQWLFPCAQWFSLYESDCQISRELFPERIPTKVQATEYEVVTVTGDRGGAGTDANVFLTLYGDQGTTARLQLYESENEERFERDQEDTFFLKTRDVGKLKKLRIEHDNTGRAPGWYLEEVRVVNRRNKRSWICPCKQWLAKDEADGRTCRDLIPIPGKHSDDVKEVSYNITTRTGTKRGAGTDADVFITIFGKNGDSGELQLTGSGNLFEKGNEDEFQFRIPDLGKLKKVRIRHDNSGAGPGWLSKTEDDGKISRDLKCSESEGGDGVPYDITIVTGKQRHAGTNANVFIEFHGGKKSPEKGRSSGKIPLDGEFAKGGTDEIRVDVGGDYSPLGYITIGHDNAGMGAGWFLDKVIVYSPLSGLEQHFPCGKWLATDEDDGLIERDLKEANHLRAKKGKKIPWDVVVETSDKRKAGTDANVLLTIYGDKGKSDPLPLEAEGNPFERGQTDQFLVETPKIGVPYKIRVQHDGTGVGAGWHLQRIELTNRTSGKTYEFPCDEWLAENEGDGSCILELPAEGKDIKKPLPMAEYEVEVHTGKKFGAGTDADVFCCIYGEKGDTGDRPLKNSRNNRNKFEKGKIDTFSLPAVGLKKLYKLRIGHNGKGAGAGWYLEKVVVKEAGNPKYDTTFPCSRWLAEDEDDGEIVRDLYPAGSSKDSRQNLLKSTTYKLSVKTGDVRSAGTDADVYVQLFGKKGETEKIFLTHSESSKDPFERGRTDLFTVEAPSIGKLEKLKIGHNGKGLGAGWFLADVEICVPSRGESYHFPCNEWLATDEGRKRTEIELTPEDVEEAERTIPYEVTIETGDLRGGGTDANVFVQIYGSAGKTKNFNLRNKTDNFERGQTDVFKVDGADVGKIQKIRIGTDGKGMASGWFLDTVEIRKPSTKLSRKRKHDKRRESSKYGKTKKREISRGNSRQSLRRGSSFHGQQSDSSSSDDVKKGKSRRKSMISPDSDESASDEVFSDDSRKKGAKGRKKSVAQDKGRDRKRSQSLGGRKSSVGSRKEGTNTKLTRNRSLSAGKTKRRGDSSTESESHDESDEKSKRRPMSARRKSARNAHSSSEDFSDEDHHKKSRGADTKKKANRKKEGGWYDYESDYSSSEGSQDSLSKSESGESDSYRYSDDSDAERPSTSKSSKTLQRRKSTAYSDYDSEDELKKGRRKTVQKGRRNKRSGSESESEGEEEEKETKKERLRQLQRKSSMLIAENLKKKTKAPKKNKKKRKDEESSDSSESEEKSEEEKTDSDSEDSQLTARQKFEKARKASAKKKDKKDTKRESKKKGSTKKTDDVSEDSSDSEDEKEKFERYLFVCRRWFAKSEDDGKLVRELLPTDDNGQPLQDNDLDYVPYEVHVFTGDVSGAGTDANVFINLYGEDGDTGERQLDKSATNKNKFERNQEDVFTIEAAELGKLRKLKVWHDNSGVGAAWFLDRIEVMDTANDEKYIFPCEKWMSTKKDDGQISRELIPVTQAQMRRLSKSRKGSVREELGLEMSNQVTPYYVFVKTGTVRGAGTDANVYVVLYGEEDDSGTVYLKTSRTNKNKFENGKTDEFVVEAVDLGDIRKILIGHDNKGGFADWYLESVEVDCPALGRRWEFPANRWLAKNKEDGQLVVELFPSPLATQEYDACIPHEFTIHTSDKRGAGTDSNVFVALFGEKGRSTREVPLCPEKSERKTHFNRSSVDKFIVELEDVGEVVTKLRIGHDGKSWGAGWHLDRVELKKMLPDQKGFLAYSFPCGRWLAKDEDDGNIVRDLLPSEAHKELIKSDGSIKQRDLKRQSSIKMKRYQIKVYTGDVSLAGTDSNVFINVIGKNGDTGKRKLAKSETHKNKFERGKVDVFNFEFGDLGEVYKAEVEHDDTLIKSDWFLEKIEVVDVDSEEMTIFNCNKWLGKGKDRELKRTLFAKGFDENTSSDDSNSRDGRRGSKKQQRKNASKFSDSDEESPRTGSRTSARSSLKKEKNKKWSESEDDSYRTYSRSSGRKRRDSSDEDDRRSVIPYTIKVTTGEDRDCGSQARAWIRIGGGQGRTEKLQLEILGRDHEFLPGSQEVFSLDARDVKEITDIEVGMESESAEDAWFVREIEVSQPTKGNASIFRVEEWFGRGKSGGKGKRRFYAADSATTSFSFRPLLRFELSFLTAPDSEPGTDWDVWVKLFGRDGTSNAVDIPNSETGRRFQPGELETIQVDLEDVGDPLKLRIGLGTEKEKQKKMKDKKLSLERVGLVNLFTDKEYKFRPTGTLSLNPNTPNEKPIRDFPAVTSRGKPVLPTTSYTINVTTSNLRGAGTNANVCCSIFGEFGDSGDIDLKHSVTYKNKFERNHTDVFHLNEILALGRLSRFRIWHDNSGLGASWHLDKVEVQDMSSEEKYVFPCKRWLSASEDDRQLCRELVCEQIDNQDLDSDKSGRTVYEITVVTGDKREAGTDHHAWLTLASKKQTSKKFWIENSSRKGILQRGQVDHFKFKTQHLGKLSTLTLGHYPKEREVRGKKIPKERDNSWFCQEIRVVDPSERAT